MRVGYLISQYPTVSHSFLVREVRELRALGAEIEIASVRNPDRVLSELTAGELEEASRAYYIRADAARWPLFHLQTMGTRPAAYFGGLALAVRSANWDLARLFRHLRFFGEAVVAGQWMRAKGLDHVHTHFASLTAMLMERIFGVALSMTIHGSDEFIDPAGFCMAAKVRASRFVIGISRYGCSQIMRFSDPLDWDKVSMVRLGINPEEFEPAAPKPDRDCFEIVTVGRLVPVKAYRFLLRACARLISARRRLKLIVIGGGPERDALEALARDLEMVDAVEFTGPLPNDRVRERVRGADCFALSSFAEGVPVVLMEAMALAVPCVATRVTGVPELIEHEKQGLLVAPADEKALAAAIARLMDDEQLRAELGANGRKKILSEYDLRENARELMRKLSAVRAG
jgi:glycosyltransferase involved in cell wall biosynthesis